MATNKYAIIVAGGSGSRMQSSVSKQFMIVGDRPILMHTIQRFYEADPSIDIIVVLPPLEIEIWSNLCLQYNFDIKHSVVNGGHTRFHSVQNGLNSIAFENGLVAIHDGVRMFVTTKNINDCYNSAVINKSSVLYVSPKDSIRYIDEAGNKSVDRTNYCLIQTPQTFDLKLLKEAYQTAYITSFTDDASVFEYSGHTISLVLGSYENIKITTPDDLLIAEVIFKQQYKTQQD